MEIDALTKGYHDGDIIVRQGESGDCIYVIQQGEVEVLYAIGDKTVHQAVLGEGDFFGELPFFERKDSAGTVRATVRAMGEVQVLVVDKSILLRSLREHSSLMYRIFQVMSRRIREMGDEIARQYYRTYL